MRKRQEAAALPAPEVMQCYYVTGEHNFVDQVAVPNVAAYEDFTRKHYIADPDVSHFTTSVGMDRVKTYRILRVPTG